MVDILLVMGGFVALLFGGEYLVRGAVSIAQRWGVSPMVIGLTLVGFGTSMPELLTSLQAAFAGSPGIAVGNVIGSNIANILLILGAAAIIAPITVSRNTFARDGTILVAATVLCIALALTGSFSRTNGVIFLLGLGAFLFVALRNGASDEDLPVATANITVAVAMFAGGLLVTLFGAKLLVVGAIGMARDFGVSEAVIGLTVVAIGTSLPELVTSVIAARKGQSDMALGNIFGSNIFNILGILGVTALVKPIGVPAEILQLDIWVMAAATALLLAVCCSGWIVTRREGGVMLALYVVYLGWLAI